MGGLPDLYATLNISREASADLLERAYRSAARSAHPDAGGSHEAFLDVDLARRVLSDPDTRSRYDAVMMLQDLIAAPSRVDRFEAERVLEAARCALAGWRCPTDLAHGVTAVIDRAVRWLDDSQWAGSGGAEQTVYQRRNRARSSPDPDLLAEMRRMVERLRAQRLDLVVDLMQAWPALVQSARFASTLGERRSSLGRSYRAYVALRNAQDDLRTAGGIRIDDDARLYLHVCCALVDVAEFIRTTQGSLARNYSLKDPRWLRTQVDMAWRTLLARGVAAGDPPWPATERAAQPHRADHAGAGSTPGPGGTGTMHGGLHRPNERSSASDEEATGVASHTSRNSVSASWWAIASSIVAVLLYAGWTARHTIGDAVATAAAAAIILAFGWLLIHSKSARVVTWAVVVAALKMTGFVLVLTARVLAGVLGLASRRR